MQLCIMLCSMLETYFDQLQREADRAGVDLSQACSRAGIAATTLQRWKRGEVSPREATAKAIIEKIREMGGHPEPSEAA